MINEQEIQQLYEKYGFMIHGRCLRMLGSQEDARDAMQVVFMQLIDKYDTIRDKTQVVSWIFRTAQNHCFNVLRSRKNIELAVDADEVGEVDEIEERLQKKQILRLIMGRISKKVRDAVHYTYIEELDQRAIEKLTGQSPATIRRNLKRFRDLLPSARRELGI
ncbi:MAG: sigma-70 family RNA polymerase sigma factor [Chitinispirillaceae bacterium]|nr:sigma-70 family RNA polymerase sigma factor [Chitinispirillaceae bacterium]